MLVLVCTCTTDYELLKKEVLPISYVSRLESGREKQRRLISNTEKISEISYPFVILIESLAKDSCSGKHLKVEMCMILMTLIFNLIKVTLNHMTLMHHKFLDLRYQVLIQKICMEGG